jgi:hypothetical protein
MALGGQAGGLLDRAARVAAAEADRATWAVSARRSNSGSLLPRFSARRRMPAQALPLKKYFCGIESRSSTCHKERAAAALTETVVLG